jgi:hypothetical protein
MDFRLITSKKGSSGLANLKYNQPKNSEVKAAIRILRNVDLGFVVNVFSQTGVKGGEFS